MEVLVKLVVVLVVLVFEVASFRIAGGRSIKITEVPYVVALLKPETGDRHCTGIIIAPNVILSAAHCFKFKGYSSGEFIDKFYPKLLVRAGSELAQQGGVLTSTTNVTLHPKWLTDKLYYDISIARVKNAFTFDSKIKAIALPNQGEVLTPGTIGKAIGFGVLADRSFPEELQAVDLPVVSNAKCEKVLKNDEKNYSPFQNKSTFCAGFENQPKTGCPGDSGGPFVVKNVLYGITSFGICGKVFPSYFFEVAQYVNEIDKLVKEYTEE